MTEKKMWKRMQLKLENHLFLQRIESETGLGIPDIAYAKDETASGWIELKAINKFPKNDEIVIPFRPGQLAWIHRYIKYSKHVYLFLYIDSWFFIMEGQYILPQYTRQNIHMLSCYDAIWKHVNWKDIFNLL